MNILGKSLISKEKANQKEEKERIEKEMGLKSESDPVFFIAKGGVDNTGFVDDNEHIFDLFTKLYDDLDRDVQILSAQDLWSFYESKHKGANRKDVDIYFLVEFFIQHHSNGHFIIDECPFLETGN